MAEHKKENIYEYVKAHKIQDEIYIHDPISELEEQVNTYMKKTDKKIRDIERSLKKKNWIYGRSFKKRRW